MVNTTTTNLRRALVVVVILLICKVTVAVMLGYSNYFPPNFQSDFLQGRDGYFFGAYQWAFYPHIASGPAALFMGMLLISERFRLRFPKWHRRLGRVHVMNVLVVVSPSGLWMAYETQTGTIAAISFAILAVATATCSAFGWRAAVTRQFAIHRRWMTRSFVLLCSAVVLRIFGGLGTVLLVRSPWFDPLVSWASWLVPLVLLELSRLTLWRIVRY
jgi:hypothetical protein